MRVLVTGASGFLGRAVCREFIERGIETTALVRRVGALDLSVCETICVDLRDEVATLNALNDRQFEVVIDAAALMKNTPAANLGDQDYFDNILMTRNLLRSLRVRSPPYFARISTIDVYSLNNDSAAITEDTPIDPQSHYSLSKYLGDRLCQLWAREHSVPLVILRPTQLFGGGDTGAKFIPSAIRCMREHSKIIISGDGSERRDYLFVEDAARIIADCAVQQVAGVLNLATGASRSLNEVAATLKAISSREISLEYEARKKPKLDYAFDMRKLRNALGPIRLTPFPEALKKTYDAAV